MCFISATHYYHHHHHCESIILTITIIIIFIIFTIIFMSVTISITITTTIFIITIIITITNIIITIITIILYFPRYSKPGPGLNIKFLPEIKSLKKATAELQQQGVNKIIALGHAGIEMDKRVAMEVVGVDVVVGGHTNTFLYSGKVTYFFNLM